MSARDEPFNDEGLRVPPHSLDAEQSVLGALLLDNAAWDRVADLLREQDFYRHEHRLIYAVIGSLINAHKPADVITAHERLAGTKGAEDITREYVGALADGVPSARNVRRYAEIVAEKSLRRSIIAAADQAVSTAYDNETAAPDALEQIGDLFMRLQRGTMRKAPVALESLMVRAIDRYNEIAEGGGPKGWPTGVAPLDRMLRERGLVPGKVYGIGARPSVGKSSLGRSVGLSTATQGLPTLLLSQEMPGDELADCIVAQLGGIDNEKLATAQFDGDDWGRVSEAVDTAAKLPFFVDDQGGLTLADIRAKAKQVRDLKVLILDYLQLTGSTLRDANRNAQIEEVSRGLKALAMEMGIAVLVLSQLNRDVEKRGDKEPNLSDLRDSGAVEQDLDIVLLLWTARKHDNNPRRVVGAKLAKQRGGRIGRFALEFHADVYRWYESTYDLSGPTRTEQRGGFE